MSIGYGRESHGTQEVDWEKKMRAPLSSGTHDTADALKDFSGNKIGVYVLACVRGAHEGMCVFPDLEDTKQNAFDHYECFVFSSPRRTADVSS